MTYDPKKADINMEESEDFGEYVAPYGGFKAHIESCEAVEDPENPGQFLRTTKSGKMQYVLLRANVTYNRGDKNKTEGVFLMPGLWFTEPLKSAMEVLGLTKEQAKDPESYVGKDITIVRGAEDFRAGGKGHEESFQGKLVREWEGKRFISTKTLRFAPYREGETAMSAQELEEHANLWTAFKAKSNPSNNDPKGGAEVATDESVKETFSAEEKEGEY